MTFYKMFYINPQKGSVAMEYIIVSIFSIIVGMAALGAVVTFYRQKIAELSEKLGVTITLDIFETLGL